MFYTKETKKEKEMKYILSVTIVCSLLTMMVVLSGCSAKFDGYDPSTAMVRWILTSSNKWKLGYM